MKKTLYFMPFDSIFVYMAYSISETTNHLSWKVWDNKSYPLVPLKKETSRLHALLYQWRKKYLEQVQQCFSSTAHAKVLDEAWFVFHNQPRRLHQNGERVFNEKDTLEILNAEFPLLYQEILKKEKQEKDEGLRLSWVKARCETLAIIMFGFNHFFSANDKARQVKSKVKQSIKFWNVLTDQDFVFCLDGLSLSSISSENYRDFLLNQIMNSLSERKSSLMIAQCLDVFDMAFEQSDEPLSEKNVRMSDYFLKRMAEELPVDALIYLFVAHSQSYPDHQKFKGYYYFSQDKIDAVKIQIKSNADINMWRRVKNLHQLWSCVLSHNDMTVEKIKTFFHMLFKNGIEVKQSIVHQSNCLSLLQLHAGQPMTGWIEDYLRKESVADEEVFDIINVYGQKLGFDVDCLLFSYNSEHPSLLYIKEYHLLNQSLESSISFVENSSAPMLMKHKKIPSEKVLTEKRKKI